MTLKVDLIPNERKKIALAEVTDAMRANRGRHDPTYLALKAVMADLHGRMELPRSNTLGELERSLARLEASRVGQSYDSGQLQALAQTLMKHWPTVRQALEQFGEVSAE